MGLSIPKLISLLLVTSTGTSTNHYEAQFQHLAGFNCGPLKLNGHAIGSSLEEELKQSFCEQDRTQGRWSSGYDIAFTRRWSGVRIPFGPPKLLS